MRNMPMVSLAVISLLASMATATAKAARVTRTPAAMTFADRTVAGNGAQDRITSDGLGTYGNGVDGVACVIFSSTGDANCDLSSSRNPVRVFNVDPSLKISGTGPTYSAHVVGYLLKGTPRPMDRGEGATPHPSLHHPSRDLLFLSRE